ncbi:uncharacterized protein LOC116295620 isoform X4 [Actinia tenebrosa]|uniref:Uncharacterized protein LOC116295620 isoform X4 n=1 Tax=Actinia tenebrosa TaxID=6105 RepID=A0A6P8I3F9_ACTTE|nr:uncharacterized protein LOC116295620 isoform X4 [Actinia tenebrosa]
MTGLFLALLMVSEMAFPMSLANKNIDEGKGIKMKDYLSDIRQGKRSYEETYKRNEPARSCLDHLKKGESGAKVFTIITPKGPQEVFCDLRSEAGSAWTLVMSYQLQYSNKSNIAPFQKPLNLNLPVNVKSPNYNMYRMTLDQMTNIKSHSTHWRVTCNSAWVDYNDYLRVRFADLDPLTFIGGGVCKKVEFINVRGHVGIEVTAAFWQIANKEILHHDSSASHCSFGPSQGYAPSEDNFGFYKNINKKFRCSGGFSSTTNMWFGAYL